MAHTEKDSFDDIWELAEFCASEALALRSFLEYMRTWPDALDKKMKRLDRWQREVGNTFGNPQIGEQAKSLFQTLRAVPPEVRANIVREVISKASSNYFGDET